MSEAINLLKSTDNQLTLEGSIIRTFFQSNDSLYKVLLVNIQQRDFKWDDTEITVTGDFGNVTPNTDYVFHGQLVTHPKYGKQFRVDSYQTHEPTSREGLIAYLSGNNFPGIGKSIAGRVVDDLGSDLIKAIDDNPQILKPLGLTTKQTNSIIKGIKDNKGDEQIIISLNSYGFGRSLTSKIYKRYGNQTLQVIQNNPYQLVEDIRGISFKKADQLAIKMGFKINSEQRIRAGIITSLNQLSLQEGGTYTEMKSLLNQTFDLLNNNNEQMINMDSIAKQIVALGRDGKIIGDRDYVYLRTLYDDEGQIADNIKRILDANEDQVDSQQIDQKIRTLAADSAIDYDPSQKRALKMAMQSPLFLLTGGPGTGKTTIIKGIITLYAQLHNLSLDFSAYDEKYPFLLAAPTGRAAKRMKETTGVEASTIHRLLGLDINDQNQQRDDTALDQQLDGKILIIDEMSMVDTYLFNILLNAVPSGMKVILVGDKDQLPSVGPGQIFHDLLDSNVIPKIELNTIHRQKNDSTIVSLAHAVRMGKIPDDFKAKAADRTFVQCDANQVVSAISQVVMRAKNKFNMMDLQVLAPMYRGEDGINHLNQVIQGIFNPPTADNPKTVQDRDFNYRIGDKVLQLENDSQNNVFNGDIGKIVSLHVGSDDGVSSPNDKIIVSFGENVEVTYPRKNFDQITLAYCTSIHKAQGCEFNTVILPMVPQYHRMLKRNLLYTAITRATKYLILIGDYSAFKECIEHQSVNRKTGLISRLRKLFNDNDQINSESKQDQSNSNNVDTKTATLTAEMIQSGQINPMIGMEGIKPQDYNA